ncbi:MAG: hypothetical protein U0Q15_03550 [Kineosporiaceae bacterium]
MSGRRSRAGLRLVAGLGQERPRDEADAAPEGSVPAPPEAAVVPASPQGPLDAVMAQVMAGTGDPLSISLLTGMDISLVRACLDHLVRTGRLRAEVLASACSGVCGGCPATQMGCGSASAAGRGEAVGADGPVRPVRGLRVISVVRR